MKHFKINIISTEFCYISITICILCFLLSIAIFSANIIFLRIISITISGLNIIVLTVRLWVIILTSTKKDKSKIKL